MAGQQQDLERAAERARDTLAAFRHQADHAGGDMNWPYWAGRLESMLDVLLHEIDGYE